MRMLPRTARLLLWIFAIALAIGVSVQEGYSQDRKAVNLSPARGLPFSDGIVAGNTLYIAGQEGTDESDKLVAGGIGPETTAALDNSREFSRPPASN